MTKLGTILDQIDSGSMLLPEFQRGYVWNRDQMRGLMKSLYHGYPVGALLVWEAEGGAHPVRGVASVSTGPKQLLLDGQQRITTLYAVVRGHPPAFYQGDPGLFGGLYFNVETEAFQFMAPTTARRDPLWIDVTGLFTAEPGTQYDQLIDQPWMRPQLGTYLDRLLRLQGTLEREFYVDRITGPDKTVDVVVDIFNRVNSGGTKLSKGDLALARICAEWSDARPVMRRLLEDWQRRQFTFTEDWLLRNINAVTTGKAPFAALSDVTTEDFKVGLAHAAQNIDHLLELVTGRLGLDHDRVISSGRQTFPIITRLLHNGGGRFADGAAADKALYWFVHAALRGRFAGSTETALAKDLELVDRSGVDGLIAGLRRSTRRGLAIVADDFDGLGRGSRAYPLLYMITRVTMAKDLATNRPLTGNDGAPMVLEIFPKEILYRAGYSRGEVNAVANFAFVTPPTAFSLARRPPHEYLPYCPPETLRTQWIPADKALWEVERYRDFLAARRELLAADTQEFLEQLAAGKVDWTAGLSALPPAPDADAHDARAAQIKALVDELTAAGFSTPQLDTEIVDPATGAALSVAEAFWPSGLQAGQGGPVVLELDPDEVDRPRLAELGYEVFTSVDALRGYAQRRSQVASGDREDEGSPAVGESDEVVEPPAAEVTPAANVAPVADVASPPVAVQRSAVEAPLAVDTVGAPAAGHPDPAALLESRLVEISGLWRTELGYRSRQLVSLIAAHGGLGTVRRLLAAPMAGDAFVFLWERQRLDLSVEALVLEPCFVDLLTETERNVAKGRLDEFGYEVGEA